MIRSPKKYSILSLVFGILFFWSASISHAATVTWTAIGGLGANWNVGGNWSSGSIPKSGDNVIFSASSTANCTINANVNVAGITITSSYTGTITQSSGDTITVGASGFSQTGGTFTGASGNTAITINGPFSLTGGIFTSSAGTLQISGASSTFQNTFQNNSGTIMFSFSPSLTAETIVGSSTFYNVVVAANGDGNDTLLVATNTILTAQGYFYPQTNNSIIQYLGGGEIDAKGNLEIGYQSNYATGTVNVVVNGSGNQIIGDATQLGFVNPATQINLPNLTINKPSGSLTLANTIYINGNYTNMNGTAITPGTSTVDFGPGPNSISAAVSSTVTLAGSSTFYNLVFGNLFATQDTDIIIATNTVLTAKGYVYPETDESAFWYLGGGEIEAQGNIEAGYQSGYATGTASFVVDGTGNQIIGDDTLTGSGSPPDDLILPNLTINKSSGMITLASQIDIAGNWTNVNTTQINPGTSTVGFGPSASLSLLPSKLPSLTETIIGSSTFYNLVFGAHDYGAGLGSSIFTIATNTVLTAQGYVYPDTDESLIKYLGGGEIEAQGNIEAGYQSGYATGTASFVVDGTGNQIIGDDTLTGSGNGADSLNLPNLTINKASGSVAYIQDPVIIGGNTIISRGELSLATGTFANSFESDGTLTVSGGAVLSDYPGATSTVMFGSGVVNNGLIFFDGDGQGCSFVLPNFVILNSTTTGSQIPWSGSGNFVMRYVNVEDQGGTAPISVLNGTQGTDVGGNWNFASGPEPQAIQTSTASGGSGTTQLTLPFGFQPRAGDMILVAISARNQTILTPTDTYNNPYTLVASTAFGSSPSYTSALYYTKNITNGYPFSVTVQGVSGSNQFLSASAFEYTGITPSSTFNASSSYIDTSGGATTLTSLSASGDSSPELYFGVAAIGASTTVNSGPGWTTESGVTDNTNYQALYTEDMGTSSILTTPALWTSATGTPYGAILGIFRAPYQSGYAINGSLDSATFDTGVPAGTQLNSVVWQGTLPGSTQVEFQFAVSNSSSGPWNFEGPDGTSATYFGPINPGIPQNLISTTNGYGLFSGYRYFRYRIFLYSDPTHTYSPTVNQVVVNWSP